MHYIGLDFIGSLSEKSHWCFWFHQNTFYWTAIFNTSSKPLEIRRTLYPPHPLSYPPSSLHPYSTDCTGKLDGNEPSMQIRGSSPDGNIQPWFLKCVIVFSFGLSQTWCYGCSTEIQTLPSIIHCARRSCQVKPGGYPSSPLQCGRQPGSQLPVAGNHPSTHLQQWQFAQNIFLPVQGHSVSISLSSHCLPSPALTGCRHRATSDAWRKFEVQEQRHRFPSYPTSNHHYLCFWEVEKLGRAVKFQKHWSVVSHAVFLSSKGFCTQ